MVTTNSFKRAWRARDSRLRLLLWSLLIGLVFGALQLGQPIEDILRSGRNKLLKHDASGEIVIVGIDESSIEKLGSWPWPRRRHAELIEKLDTAGASQIAFDILFSAPSDPAEDVSLEKALAKASRPVVLATLGAQNPVTGQEISRDPLPAFRRHSRVASIDVYHNRHNAVWEIPFRWKVASGTYPSLAAILADAGAETDASFPIDYAIDMASIPVISAVDVIQGKAAAAIAGKKVLVGTTTITAGDIYFAPGFGRIPGVYIHAAAAETLKRASPVRLGWFPALAAALTLAAASLWLKRERLRVVALATAPVSLLIAAVLLQIASVIVDIVPALVLLLWIAGRYAYANVRLNFRNRGLTNPVSGLPNLTALRTTAGAVGRPLVACRIRNFAEVASALPPEQAKALSLQVAKRLALGGSDLKLYHDEGVFAWFLDVADAPALHDHLDALHAMFRSPVLVSGDSFDLTISFGVDATAERSLTNRLGSALVAADEASDEGRRWKEYDPDRLKDAAWRLSLLSQLDAAIDAGDLWVAFQPKLDLASGCMIGAEALARWTHAEKGPISPLEFIAAAEQNDRIEKLTHYVLDQGIAAAAAMNALGLEFGIAVNLSARLIDDAEIVNVVARLLATHRLAAKHLTLEVTETAAANISDSDFRTLDKLRRLGVQISIDDYGTGLSTLNYLRRIPATEIKIDRSFVQAMSRSHDDRVLVTSTIELAHSLGHRVVAEGVEDRDTLDALTRAGCDVAQGYFIGKPLPLNAFQREFFKSRRSRAA